MQSQHQYWLAALASAPAGLLHDFWNGLERRPEYELLRPVEIGMTLLRARIGGRGAPFNFGEATMTRAAARLATGQQGFSYLLGRRPVEAEAAAVLHAMLQTPEWHDDVDPLIRRVLQLAQEKARRTEAAVAETKVDFMTMVRGND